MSVIQISFLYLIIDASHAKQRLALLPASNESFDEVQKWIRTQSILNATDLV